MIYIEFNEELLEEHKVYIQEDSSLKKGLIDLRTIIVNNKALEILEFVISNLENIVCCNYEGLIRIQKKFIDYIYSLGDFDDNDIGAFKVLHNQLSDKFIAAYDHFTKRDINSNWNSYIYLKKINQSVCPYCNANFIQSTQASKILKGSNTRAMPDLDHFLPKSLFPIFAITLANLIPSCIYCNQRFKGSYETNFKYFFSPFDKNIKDSFTFKINYSNANNNDAFGKLNRITNELSNAEKFYNNLISKVKVLSKQDKKTENIANSLGVYLDEILLIFNDLKRTIIDNRPHLKHKHITDVYQKLDDLLEKGEEFLETIRKINNLKRIEVISNFNYYFIQILENINDFRKSYEDLNNLKRIKGIIEIKKCLTKFKNIILEFEKKINGVLHYDFDTNNDDKGSFVECVLGESTNYCIEVEASNDLTEENKNKVYHNAALFQLEAIYNQFKPYLNRKIKQSYIVNSLYLKQLDNQFPGLFTEQEMVMTVDTLLIDYENIRNEVLGKLLFDILLPTIKEQNHKDLLLLLNVD